ncbi:TBC1 domain family member 30 isoform X1 [Carcharodon carcharias]|uniref:TBC1 domain family member 30 isoform X1 n=1 Tax=Carcharodon carcharias TaxID=13397 RepID=UPI001B7ECC84|nr:TBC1 domain family member 30 isoform X1 [Carcharodon carcharias]
MAASLRIPQNELSEIDISNGNCPEGENAAFPSDGMSGFQHWMQIADSQRTAQGPFLLKDSANIPPIPVSSSMLLPTQHWTKGTIAAEKAAGSHIENRGREYQFGTASIACKRTSSIVDCLLTELYDSCAYSSRSIDSVDSSTETSSSDAFLGRSNSGSMFLQEFQEQYTAKHQMQYLAQKDVDELKRIVEELKYRIAVQSAKLVRQLRRKDNLSHKLQKNSDIVTACLQAVSQKRRVDTKLKFTIQPSLNKHGFQQWYDALKAVARLPTGIPKDWRKRVWLTLADQYLHSISIDWEKTMRFAFNDRSNPDDDSMGIQIVKDLHRTGCSSYCGQEAEQDRVMLKRVLLAYARWNKFVGYCQGFNVLAALILEVMEGNEGDALKVMIYLIDKVLPESYFANNLRALSVDMAVFRDLLRIKLPELSQYLDNLQKGANKESAGSYEPPLTNVFTMQWFLTLFATCLPNHTVLRIWDSVFFEGSEVILRVALAIWAKLGERIESCQSADEFYSTMGKLTQEMLEDSLIDCNELMQTLYSMAPFPFPQLAELREKYTYNINPFPAPVKSSESQQNICKTKDSDEEIDLDDEDIIASAVGCLGPFSLLVPELQKYQKQVKDQQDEQILKSSNIAELSPGAIDASRSEHHSVFNSMMMERMTTDINALKRQYIRIKKKQQQQQAHLIFIKAGIEDEINPGIIPDPRDKLNNAIGRSEGPATTILPSQINQTPMMNHLLLGKKLRATNRITRNAVIHVPGAKTSQDDIKSKLNSPWRTHIRVHRKNLARTKNQLSYSDTIGLMEEQSDITKEKINKPVEESSLSSTESTEADSKSIEDRILAQADGQSSELVYRDANDNVNVIQHQLKRLDLNQSDTTAAEPPSPSPSQGHSSDSSDSEKGISDLGHRTSTLKIQPFSPFPSVKPPRKSAAARNLGLYGPTERTPTVHFPHMNKSVKGKPTGTRKE